MAKALCSQGRGGPGSIPGQGTRIHAPQLETPHATAKARAAKQTMLFLKKEKCM